MRRGEGWIDDGRQDDATAQLGVVRGERRIEETV